MEAFFEIAQKTTWCLTSYQWLSVQLRSIHYWCTGDTAVLNFEAIEMSLREWVKTGKKINSLTKDITILLQG